jgi:hypothetical protein
MLDAPTSCTEFTDGMEKGIGNRVKYSTAQAHAFSVAIILEVQRRQADLITVIQRPFSSVTPLLVR